jgi:osmoprotectant transport system ATP-binding protein
VIRFEQVGKKYPDGTVAVESLSLEAPSGQITVFVGPSGCGKTTSLRMINRMIEPTSGRIMLDDRDTASFNKAELRRGIGYVIQAAGLFPHRTVVDNVATVPLLLGTDRKQARATAMELLERVGLPAEFAKRYPAQLSGGQLQRMALARALAVQPKVLLLDEPFGALDALTRAELQRWLESVWAQFRSTVLLITHDVREAVYLADRIYVLSARPGTVVAELGIPLPRPRSLTDPRLAQLETELIAQLLPGTPAPPR